MILTIAGAPYRAERIPAFDSGTAAVRLTKPDGTAYDLVRTFDGLVTCDCPSFLFRCLFTDKPCKHSLAVVRAGLIPAPNPMSRA